MIRLSSTGPRVFLLSLLGLWAVACPEGANLENAMKYHEARRGQECDARPIFEERCSGAICHGENGEEGPAGGVDLVSPGVEDRVYNVAASYKNVSDPEACPSTPELLINPASPEASLMLTKLSGTHSCGDAMPIPNPPGLSSSEQECIRRWVLSVIENGGGNGGLGGASGTGGTDGAAGAMSTGGTQNAPMPLRIQAECAFGPSTGDCDGASGSQMGTQLESNDTTIGYFEAGTWLSYSGIDLTGYTQIIFRYAKAANAGSIEVRLDSPTGTLLATFTPTTTAGWSDYTDAPVPLMAATGTHDVYLVATGDTGPGVANLDWIEFSAQ